MQKEWKSERMSWHAFFTLVLISTVFLGLFIAVFIRAFITDGDEWMFITNIWYINFLVIMVIALVISTGFFFKDWFQYNGLTIKLEDHKLHFISKNYPTKVFNFRELLHYKSVKTFYGFTKLRKVIMYFKDSKDKRRHRMIILLKEKETQPFLDILNNEKAVYLKKKSNKKL